MSAVQFGANGMNYYYDNDIIFKEFRSWENFIRFNVFVVDYYEEK